MARILASAVALALANFLCASALRPEEKKARSSILASPISELRPFQEKCDDALGLGAGDSSAGGERSGADAASTWSFLELPSQPGLGKGPHPVQLSCNWTVYYDSWHPTFESGEYEHAWEGGVHCLEACCRDPNCNSLQLLSSETYQCYKFDRTPIMQEKTGRNLGDAHWLMHKRKAWSVFVKGTPDQVAVNMAAEAARVPKAMDVNPFVMNSQNTSNDLMSFASRIGVIVVLAGLVMRILSETTVKAMAKVRYSKCSGETASLVGGGKYAFIDDVRYSGPMGNLLVASLSAGSKNTVFAGHCSSLGGETSTPAAGDRNVFVEEVVEKSCIGETLGKTSSPSPAGVNSSVEEVGCDIQAQSPVVDCTDSFTEGKYDPLL